MRHTIIILFLFSLSQAVQSQPGLNFINFSTNNGLSSNAVNAILKDKLGYMWFASDDGLNKFDGISFTVYNHNALDTNSIGENRIQSICEDARGNLWIGTNRTLSLYDRQKDCFHNYDITNGTPVRAICSDNAGHLWIGGYAGLILYDPATGHAKSYTKDSTRPGQLLSNTITCLFRDTHGRLWIGSNTGLYLYQPRTDNFKRFNNVPADPTSIGDNVIKAIAQDSAGHLWFGTNNGGLNMLEEDGVHFKQFKNSRTDANTLSSNTVFSVATDDNGDLWLGTEQGLNIFNPKNGTVQRVAGDERNKYSLKGRSIRSIYIDKHGIYWLGSFQDGINKYDKNLVFFNLVQYNLFDSRGLSSPKITSFAETDNGDMYVGTDGGGLNLFHRKTGLFDHVTIDDNKKKPAFAILTMERCGDELWIGTFQHGVYVIDIRSKSVRHFTKGDRPGDLISNEIFCIKKDTHGNMWLGTNGNGVCMYDRKLGTFQQIDGIGPDKSANKLFSNGFIRDILEDADGNMLVASVGSGLALYNPADRSCRLFNRANTNVPVDEVISLHLDRYGTVWAGTPGSGLCQLDYKRQRYAGYAERQGLANAVIYKILEDDAGKLWVSTNKGISCFDPATSTFKNYGSQNGIQQSSFNGGSGTKTASGELFFGGLEGFNYFLPRTLKDNKNIPAIVFTDLKIGGHSVAPGKNAAIKENIAVASSIRLDYKQNFSVDFVALDYTTPRQNRYMYRLDAFDKSWNEIGSSRTAVFTNLYPGNYTLEVKAKNANGAWVTLPATIKIFVKPPLWLTGYAYAFYILMIGLLLWAIRYRGIRKIKNKFALEQERLQMKETIERERLEAERLHQFDELKIKFLTNLSHEFRTPISLILGPVEQLHEKEDDPDKRGQLAMVKRNARRLINLVNELLDFRKLGERELNLNCTQCDIVSFVKEAAESFKDVAERKHIHFSFKTGLASFYTSFDRDKIERVLFNLLGNAFKFTGNGGKIMIEIKQQSAGKELMIVISDTGIGIPAYEHDRIFNRFYQGNAHASVMNQGSGIGLSITKEFVRLHGGTITVESEPEQGSVFTISLPLVNAASAVNEIVINENGIDIETLEPETASDVLRASNLLTVLLVEDNDDFRNYLKENLKSSYKIVEACDGKEGWQKALSRHPDVIVSDISMPNMDGIELSRKIKSDKRTGHIPIILLTALTGDANQLKGLETGANDYLTKPFNFQILNARIKNLFDLNQTFKNTYTRQLKIVTPVSEVESEDDKLMLAVCQYIEANLNSPKLSVEELSRHVCMSRGSFYNKIVSLTGETPVEFIRSVKLNKAAALLENSDMKIAQIGYVVGFTTPNYFARAFKAKFNVLPSEYAQQKRHAST